MEIDRVLVQEMIDNSVGSEYVINEFIDTSKYLFITYKHRDYYADDERGKLIGSGPIVYHKETKEYKTSGSGQFVCGEYAGYLNENDNYVEKQWTVEEIKSGILRRQFVNDDDIWNLSLFSNNGNADLSASMTKNRDYNLGLHGIYCSDNTYVILYFEKLWIELKLKYEILNPNQILLWKNM
jgi:hypothetical protein